MAGSFVSVDIPVINEIGMREPELARVSHLIWRASPRAHPLSFAGWDGEWGGTWRNKEEPC